MFQSQYSDLHMHVDLHKYNIKGGGFENYYLLRKIYPIVCRKNVHTYSFVGLLMYELKLFFEMLEKKFI